MTIALKHCVQLDSHKDIIKVRFICQGGLDRSVGKKPVALVWGICNMLPWGGEAGGGTGRSRENMKILSTKFTASACSFLAKNKLNLDLIKPSDLPSSLKETEGKEE